VIHQDLTLLAYFSVDQYSW